MKKMSLLENIVYYLSVVCTLGGLFVMKCVIKKAIVDSHK